MALRQGEYGRYAVKSGVLLGEYVDLRFGIVEYPERLDIPTFEDQPPKSSYGGK